MSSNERMELVGGMHTCCDPLGQHPGLKKIVILPVIFFRTVSVLQQMHNNLNHIEVVDARLKLVRLLHRGRHFTRRGTKSRGGTCSRGQRTS